MCVLLYAYRFIVDFSVRAAREWSWSVEVSSDTSEYGTPAGTFSVVGVVAVLYFVMAHAARSANASASARVLVYGPTRLDLRAARTSQRMAVAQA